MTGSLDKSEALFARAQALIPGGVSSPVRAFKHVATRGPLYMQRASGAQIVDVDGRSYVDFCMAWGPLILGHAHPAVVEAVTRAARDGLAFGTVHALEVALAERVLARFPEAERVRFVVSGTEAVQTALRIARAHTGRTRVLKFSGCYHGHTDAMLVKAGSGLVTAGVAESAGVVGAAQTLVAPLGDEAALEAAFSEHGSEIACAILEPLPANNGLLVQRRAWLERLRALTRAHGALLIFDEVITGFRFAEGGFQQREGIAPDLTTLGKILGGGLPVAAVIGKRELLDRLAPLGDVYQAGTMAGNPVALAAGVATLDALADGEIYARLAKLGDLLEALCKPLPLQLVRSGPMFWIYLDEASAPTTAEAIAPAAMKRFSAAYQGYLDRGLYLPPSAYEVGFLCAAHTEEHIRALVGALH